MSLHLYKAHRIKNVVRRYIGSEVHCIVCLKQFWTRERLVNHVRFRSCVCRDWHMKHPPKYTCDEAHAFDRACAEQNRALQAINARRHVVMTPCVQLEGPLLPSVIEHHSRHHPQARGHNYNRYSVVT